MNEQSSEQREAGRERERVLALRQAFRAGIEHALTNKAGYTQPHEVPDGPCAICDREAESRYPLPKVSRPRVVKDPHDATYTGDDLFWRVDGRCVVLCDNRGHVFGPIHMSYSPERIKVWADLLASPNELVECSE